MAAVARFDAAFDTCKVNGSGNGISLKLVYDTVGLAAVSALNEATLFTITKNSFMVLAELFLNHV